MPNALLLLFLSLLASALPIDARATPDPPADLTINEGRVAPLGFHDATPTFSWKLQDDRQDAAQRGYQLVVVKTKAAIVWDSGRIDSDQSVYVPYEGPTLSSRDKALWRVRYWDQHNVQSEWSEWTSFELGLLSNKEWKGQWIHQPLPMLLSERYDLLEVDYGAPDGNRVSLQDELAKTFEKAGRDTVTLTVGDKNGTFFPKEDPAPGIRKIFRVKYRHDGKEQIIIAKEDEKVSFATTNTDSVPVFRKNFTLPEPTESARLYITSRGIFQARINGKPVGKDFMTPGWTNYDVKIETLTYDVTELLVAGENTLEVEVAKGWYAGTILDSHWGDVPQLLAQLEVDGEAVVVTDSSWKFSTAGPLVMSDIYNGADYDANRQVTTVSYQDVVVSELSPTPALRPKAFQTVRVVKGLNPLTMDLRQDGRVIYNLGQNMVGTFVIKIPVKKNQKVTIKVAEMLKSDGSLYRENYRAARSLATYLPAADGVISYRPEFTFFGFQYLQIEGFDAEASPDKDWVRGLVLHTDFAQTGTFTSSHAKLNQLQSNIEWSQRGNFLDIPTDCPQRDERLGWTGDAQAFSPVALHNFDTHAFFNSWMESMRIEQKPDGMVPNIIPPGKYLDWGNAPGWGDAIYLIPWQIYLRTGDRSVLEDNLEAMRRRVGWYRNNSENHLVQSQTGFGDWLQPVLYEGTDQLAGPPQPDGTPETRYGETPIDFLGTCYYARGCQIIADAATVLGREELAIKYQMEGDAIAKAICENCFDADGMSTLPVETQTAYVMPLAFDLLPDGLREKAGAKLVARIRKDGDRLNTGFIGTSLLCQTLDKVGAFETASDVLFTSEYPSWFYSIDQGATTIWERWNSFTLQDGFGDVAMNSFNHYAYGAVGEFLYQRLAGLAPDWEQPGYKHIIVKPLFAGHPLTSASATLETRYGTASNSWKKTADGIEMTTVVPPNTTATIVLPHEEKTVGAGTYRFVVK